MLGLSWTEMLVIGVVALIFIGPKDLPVVMGKAGKIIGQIRRMGNEFQREINRTTGLDEVRNLRSSITDPLKKSADEIRREFNAMTPSGPKPSGAIKPSDPKTESVVDELRSAAGMAPAAAAATTAVAAPKKTNDEIAAEAGFKPTQPIKAAQVTPAPAAKAAPTAPVTSGDLPPAGEINVPDVKKPRAPRKAAKAKSAETPAGKKSGVAALEAPEVAGAEKPARKPRVAKAATPADAAPVAKRPRTPRKKPAETAEKK